MLERGDSIVGQPIARRAENACGDSDALFHGAQYLGGRRAQFVEGDAPRIPFGVGASRVSPLMRNLNAVRKD